MHHPLVHKLSVIHVSPIFPPERKRRERTPTMISAKHSKRVDMTGASKRPSTLVNARARTLPRLRPPPPPDPSNCYVIPVYKPAANTFKLKLVHPKDKVARHKLQQLNNVVYANNVKGKIAKTLTLGKQNTPSIKVSTNTEELVRTGTINFLDKEPKWFERGVRKAICIVNTENPSRKIEAGDCDITFHWPTIRSSGKFLDVWTIRALTPPIHRTLVNSRQTELRKRLGRVTELSSFKKIQEVQLTRLQISNEDLFHGHLRIPKIHSVVYALLFQQFY